MSFQGSNASWSTADTQITDAGIAELKKALPKCRVLRYPPSAPRRMRSLARHSQQFPNHAPSANAAAVTLAILDRGGRIDPAQMQ